MCPAPGRGSARIAPPDCDRRGDESRAAQFRLRVGREIGSAALVADGQHARVDGFTSLAVLIGVPGVWAEFPILDPLVGIAITIAILFIVKDAARAAWRRLIDGIEPEIVRAIEHAPTHVAGVRDVHRVRARWVGHTVHADPHISVDPDLSVRESHALTEAVEADPARACPLVRRRGRLRLARFRECWRMLWQWSQSSCRRDLLR